MKRVIKMALLVTALTVASSAHATVYNLAADWSDVSNPNGTWSLFAQDGALSHFPQPSVANTLNSAATNGYWGTGPDFGGLGNFFIKTSTNGVNTGAYNNGDFLAGDVIIHTANSGNFDAVNWTAPGAGKINVASLMWYAHSPVTRSDTISILLNGTQLGSDFIINNSITRNNALSFAQNAITVNSGDVLSYRLVKTAGQSFGSLAGLSVNVDFTASSNAAVPEPATWATMLAGFGLMGFTMRRKQQQGNRLRYA